MILYLVATVGMLMIAAAFWRDVRLDGAARTLFSHFWYFTLFIILAFPVRAILLQSGLIESQVIYLGTVDRPFDSGALPLTVESLTVALVIVLIAWLVAYLGARTVRDPAINDSPTNPAALSTTRAMTTHAATLVLGVMAIVLIDPHQLLVIPSSFFSARTGLGPLWLLTEFYLYSACVAAAAILIARPVKGSTIVWIIFLFFTGVVALYASSALFTRRPIAAVILLPLIVFVLYQRRHYWLGVIGAVGTVIGAFVLEFLRHAYAAFAGVYHLGTFSSDLAGSIAAAYERFIILGWLNLFSTSFEGVEHVSQYLTKAKSAEIIAGIDHGVSWVFNAGGALIPRSIWPTKPMVYGGTEQFRWLYPGYFSGDQMVTSIPPSFFVDFAYGFGIVFALVVSFFLGRFMRVCHNAFHCRQANAVGLAFALFTFLYMFNIIRSGSVHLQGLVLISLVCLVAIGPRQTLADVRTFVGQVFYGYRKP